MKILLTWLTLTFVLGFFVDVYGQQTGEVDFARKPLIDIRIKKTGPYLGIQRGLYTVPEFGVERQWKRVQLKNPITHAMHMGFNYNFKYNVLGYDAGYWVKPNRIGLTYGGNLFYRTDFTSDRIGVAPVIGFKFWLLHLQTGYHFMSHRKTINSNTFFVSLRLGIINERDVEWKREKKK